MAMHLWGGGVGHSSTRAATNLYLTDCDHLDLGAVRDEHEELGSDFEEEISNVWPTVDAESQNMEEDIHEHDGGDEEDETEDEDWEDIEESGDEDGLESEEEDPDEDEGELADDTLGPDDGEVDEDEVAGLGFAVF